MFTSTMNIDVSFQSIDKLLLATVSWRTWGTTISVHYLFEDFLQMKTKDGIIKLFSFPTSRYLIQLTGDSNNINNCKDQIEGLPFLESALTSSVSKRISQYLDNSSLGTFCKLRKKE